MNAYFFNAAAVIELIKQAGSAVMDIYRQDFAVYEKEDASPVTEADMSAEKIIFDGLKKLTPDIPVVGEEHMAAGEPADLTQRYFWLVDPVDGTTNFVQGVPHVGVSIALKNNGKTEVAVVFDPIKNEMFTASRGDGAQLNGRRIRVASRPSLEGSIIATAVPVRYRERMSAYIPLLSRLIDNCADIEKVKNRAV